MSLSFNTRNSVKETFSHCPGSKPAAKLWTIYGGCHVAGTPGQSLILTANPSATLRP